VCSSDLSGMSPEESETYPSHSERYPEGSGTSPTLPETSPEGSETPPNGSETPPNGSVMSPDGSETLQIGSGTLEIQFPSVVKVSRRAKIAEVGAAQSLARKGLAARNVGRLPKKSPGNSGGYSGKGVLVWA